LYSKTMNYNLREMFSLLENNDTICNKQEDLFGFSIETPEVKRRYEQADMELIAAFYSGSLNPSVLNKAGQKLFEFPAAFDTFIHVWMSEKPVIEAEIIRFGRRVLAAGNTGRNNGEKRLAAERAAIDRGDADTQVVLNASARVQHEIHRMMGLLRFSPGRNGEYIARCAPDHLILPAFGDYFSKRFGETSWLIIDDKRKLVLNCQNGGCAEINTLDTDFSENFSHTSDEWEGLWKFYHKTINNESRNNPDLQRQFMPKRYWKYLPEV